MFGGGRPGFPARPFRESRCGGNSATAARASRHRGQRCGDAGELEPARIVSAIALHLLQQILAGRFHAPREQSARPLP